MKINVDVFIDESGLFTESSLDPRERIEYHKQSGRKFASQIAGLICEAGKLTESNAEQLFDGAHRVSKVEYSPRFHASETKSQPGFSKFASFVLEQFKLQKVTPARIANDELVAYGDRIANYTNILAEFLIRICRQLSMDGAKNISLNVFAARVVKSKDGGVTTFFEEEEYLVRIREYFARAAVLGGHIRSNQKWEVSHFKILSARENRRLQLADLVSNVSHDDFSTVPVEIANELKSIMGPYDWSMSFDATMQQLDDLIDEQAYGLGLIRIAKTALLSGAQKESDRFASKAKKITGELFALPPAVRMAQLQVIASWLQQIVESRMDYAFSIRVCDWIVAEVAEHNEAAIDSEIRHWIRFVCASWALTACNHAGDTSAASGRSAELDRLLGSLAGRWEYASDMMQALIAQSVHYNDLFEHAKAAEKVSLVANYYTSLGGFFAEAYPQVFHGHVHSDLCGRALGTKVQSQTFLCLANQLDVDAVRKTSDLAIAEFSLVDDKRRQYQYRSEVEAIAGNWIESRRFLAISLGMDEISHTAIAQKIKTLDDLYGQGFALLHWIRIGGMAASANATQERMAFWTAFRSQKFEHNGWCLGRIVDYPVHGILRRLAVVYAATSEYAQATASLSRLRAIVASNPRPVFRVILIAAQLQAAEFLAKKDLRSVKDMLLDSKSEYSSIRTVSQLITELGDAESIFRQRLEKMRDGLNSPDLDFSKLAKQASVVGY